ncbi:MAG: SCO family protein [Gammaproteobacteria bacterium]|jgi:protein SCO1/2
MRSVIATLAVLLTGLTVLWQATDGARAFTTESARRLAVTQQMPAIPDVLLQDQTGKPFRISDLQGRILVVDFIYTGCLTFCRIMGNTLQQVRHALPADGAGSNMLLLSISFDPDNDTIERLRAYAKHHGAVADNWKIARVTEADALTRLLDTFGITVIPDGEGGFEHNAAVHIVNTEGRLVRVLDYDDSNAAIVALREYL